MILRSISPAALKAVRVANGEFRTSGQPDRDDPPFTILTPRVLSFERRTIEIERCKGQVEAADAKKCVVVCDMMSVQSNTPLPAFGIAATGLPP
jgi:hypothetical protein